MRKIVLAVAFLSEEQKDEFFQNCHRSDYGFKTMEARPNKNNLWAIKLKSKKLDYNEHRKLVEKFKENVCAKWFTISDF